ncbi:MAG: acyl-CoA dehydrogenase family protein, partial [Acidimicrobiia bacterium]
MSKSLVYNDDHDLFRKVVAEFVSKEITPNVDEWDEAETFPRDLYRKAGAIGLFGIGFDAEYGGMGSHDALAFVILSEELARCGAGGVPASLFSNYIGAPPIQRGGSDDVKAEILPAML